MSGSSRDGSAGGPSVAHLIDRRGRCRLAYEPVADLVRGVICGYEAVARFPDAMSPERWRAEALRRGLEPDLDAFLIRSVLDARESLPSNCFLSLNISPETLLSEPVRAVLAAERRLDRLVVELCPRVATADEAALLAAIAELRAAGATFAVDDVGGEVGTLRHLTVVRPEFVKLDPQLVAGLHRDDARLAIVETIGELASRLDAWIVAQGVGEIEELDALMRLRAPLAQGPLIGVRAKTLTRVAFALSGYVRDRGAGAGATAPGALAALLEQPPAFEHGSDRTAIARTLDELPALQHAPLVDERRRPVGMVDRGAFERGEPPTADVLTVAASSRLADVARRAMLRPPATRFHPLVCCDGRGRYVGLVRVERLVAALADERG